MQGDTSHHGMNGSQHSLAQLWLKDAIAIQKFLAYIDMMSRKHQKQCRRGRAVNSSSNKTKYSQKNRHQASVGETPVSN